MEDSDIASRGRSMRGRVHPLRWLRKEEKKVEKKRPSFFFSQRCGGRVGWLVALDLQGTVTIIPVDIQAQAKIKVVSLTRLVQAKCPMQGYDSFARGAHHVSARGRGERGPQQQRRDDNNANRPVRRKSYRLPLGDAVGTPFPRPLTYHSKVVQGVRTMSWANTDKTLLEGKCKIDQ